MSQKLFDNENFFAAYRKLRSEKNYNDLLEQPAMRRLLPGLKGKAVLDLGCGYGCGSLFLAQSGAKRVLGIDLSEKMLDVAQKDFCHPLVEYRRMDMEDLSQLTEAFDLVYSSLAFHYVEDFLKLAKDIYRLLKSGGVLLFSQEHPIVTATMNCKGHYNLSQDGEYASYTFSDYGRGGKRIGHWFIDGVENYHRPMGEIVTTLSQTGFRIEALVEPLPEPWAVSEKPDLAKEYIKPTFLIIKAAK